MTNIKSMTLKELQTFIVELGEKKFRGTQIFNWLSKGICDFGEMTNIPNSLKTKLKETAYIENITCEKAFSSSKGHTKKYLFRLDDNHIIESVYMKYHYGNSICISSQVGCGMGCSFCASTIGGLKRNLSAAEMIEQLLKIQSDINERISRVVIMGSGEPFENYDELLKFLKIVHSEEGLHMSYRNITVSTCGIIPKIIDFAHQMPQVTLAVSLHASNNSIRDSLMAVNERYPLDKLMKACKEYIAITNRRISFEYSLIQGVNDSEENAGELGNLLKNMLCHVNLIPLNNVGKSKFKGSNRSKTEKFKEELEKHGVNATIRRELGSDIEAACGQLRRRYSKETGDREQK